MHGLLSYCTGLLAFNILYGTRASPIQHTRRESAATKPAPFIADMRRVSGTYGSSRFLAESLPTSQITAVDDGAGYGVQVQFGNEWFFLMIDTGSSDTWLPSSDFQCVQANPKSPHDTSQHIKKPQAECGFARYCSVPFSGGTVPDVNFNITYGSMEFVTGTLGYERVTFAGVTIDRQEAALATYGAWHGDGTSSGLFGFAYPVLTSAFPGNDPSQDTKEQVGMNSYNPFVFNAIKEQKIAPVFGMAPERHEGSDYGGQITLGGAPTVMHWDWASTPLTVAPLGPHAPPAATTQLSFYTIKPEGFKIAKGGRQIYTKRGLEVTDARETIFIPWDEAAAAASEPSPMSGSGPSPMAMPPPDGGLSTGKFYMIVDSGTTISFVPPTVAKNLSFAMNPPAHINTNAAQGPGPIAETDCNAEVPDFAIRIGGQDFWWKHENILLTGELGQGPDGKCALGVQPAPGPPYVLGGTFMRNVVSVFDIGENLMWFASRA